MTTFNSITDLIGNYSRKGPQVAPPQIPDDYSPLYALLYGLYNNDEPLYADDTTRRLRSVVNRSVEFYASKILPGERITVIAANGQQALVDAMEAILKMSNFQGSKPAMLRGYALYGDSFIRVRGDESKVYFEDISPFWVTDFSEDSRGFLTTLRIDIPTDDENRNPILYTEYWDKDSQTLKIWYSHASPTSPIATLGTPTETIPFSEMGVDFIPVVHTKFRDTGDARGKSAVYHALDKIVEANRLTTELHDMLFRFNRPKWAVRPTSPLDKTGRPIVPPTMTTQTEEELEDGLGEFYTLPAGSEIDPLIPQINYADALAILNAQMDELEQELPELRYYSIQDSNLSGKAIKMLLAGAVDRAEEARNNFLSSLSRMLEIGLTIGIYNGLFPASLGTYQSGSFDNTVQFDEMFGETMDERATTLKALTDAGLPLPFAMKQVGFTQDEIDEVSSPAPQP